MAFENLKYAQKKRLEFLDLLFFWNGAATRASLIQKFGISNAQAALDFRTYLAECNPAGLFYDAKSRQYLATDDFQKLTGQASISELLELFSKDTRSGYDVLPDLHRSQNVRAFQPLYRAMRAQKSIEIVYQSMNQPEPEKRWVAPLRFASDGVRLHVRAWCLSRQEFRDFIPSRIDPELSFKNTDTPEKIPRDDEWFTWSILKLRPHERLSDSQKKVVRIEFGFTEDVMEIRIRQALEFYARRRWGLDQDAPRLECLSTDHIPMTEQEVNAN